MGGEVRRKFESFVGNLEGFTPPPPPGKREFPPQQVVIHTKFAFSRLKQLAIAFNI